MTTCSKCGVPKADSEFYQFKGKRHGNRCRACKIESQGVYYWKDPEASRARNRGVDQRPSKLKRTYGLTVGDFEELKKSQGGGCAICRTPFPDTPNPHVDHNHSTGKVRGLLCSQCNVGIGMFKDDPLRLNLAKEYLERHA